MIRIRKLVLGLGVWMMVVGLAACQDDTARAEEHYQNALALMAEGDMVRADLEFRNVFQVDGTHLEARERYAEMLRETGDLEHAYGQNLRLIEQSPDHVGARMTLAEMAIELQNWEEARWHGERALELAPDNPRASVIALNLQYIDAIETEDDTARRDVADSAAARFEEEPNNGLLQRLVIDSLLRDAEFETAIAIVDTALIEAPASRGLEDIRLQILAELGEADAIEQQLQTMIAQFPEDTQLPRVLLRFYVAQDDIAGAETLLTELAGAATDQLERDEALTALIRLRLEREGPDAAMAELGRIIDTYPEDATTFRALNAVLRFENGEQDQGIAELEALLVGDISQIEQSRFQVIHAQMLLQTGNAVGAQRLIETVLEADPAQTEALKMRAAWLIEDDDPDQAIQDLRIVLDEDAEDTVGLTLMAQAYARAGDRELSRDFLSLAMQASGRAPAETIRYATMLLEEGRNMLAEETLIASLRLTPNHPDLLNTLGTVYLQLGDWLRADDVERTLRALDIETATEMADRMQAAILVGRGQLDQAMQMLEAAAAADDSSIGADTRLVQARLISGDLEGALGYAQQLVADAPDDLDARQLLAMTHVALGQFAEAETELQLVTDTDPQRPQAWIDLIRVRDSLGREAQARETLAAGLEANPEAPDLLWAQASFLERGGDINGAIALYEQLYEILPNSPVVANNLSSLISTYRDDSESHERAYAIARRLRGTDVAPFADTYGWIAYQRGEYTEAVEHLERAAEGLPDDPLVQYHLGMVYLALERPEAALEQLTRSVELAGPDDPRAQFVSAREEIATLQTEMAESTPDQ